MRSLIIILESIHSMKTKFRLIIRSVIQFGLTVWVAAGLVGCMEQALINRVKNLDAAYAQGQIPYKQYKALRKKYVAEQESYSAELDRERAVASQAHDFDND